MTVAELLGVGLLGGVGAIARFVLDGVVGERIGGAFPTGTLVVNLLGAFLLGGLSGLALPASAQTLLGTGLIGAFTTFSTWMFESHRLGEDRRAGLGVLNIALSLFLGLALAWAGRGLGGAL